MPEFKPFAGEHAIQAMGFVIELAAPISSGVLVKLRTSLTERWKKELPRRLDSHSITMSVGPDVTNAPPVMRPAGPFMLDRTLPNGQSEIAFRVAPEALGVNFTVYTRWKDIWSRARTFLQSAAAELDKGPTVGAAVLTYVDRFVWDGDPSAASTEALLRPNSEFITPRVQREPGQWHCYQGFFEGENNPLPHQQLVNVNLDKKIEDNACVFEITTLHRSIVQAEKPALVNLLEPEESALDHLMSKMHERNKEILAAILSDEMCQRIALREGRG